MIREVVTGGHTYLVEDSARLMHAALAVAPVSDAMRVAGVSVMGCQQAHTGVRIADRAWLVVSGDPAVVCPDLDVSPCEFVVDLVVAGRTAVATLTVPAGSTLPFTVAVLDVTGPASAVSGTVRRASFPRTPIAGAAVAVSGAHPAGALLGLRAPVASAHAAGTTISVRTVATGATHTVTSLAAGGATSLELNTVVGLAPGEIIALGNGEFASVEGVDAPNLVVHLRLPIVRTRRIGDSVTPVTVGAPGVATTLARQVERGDDVIVTTAPLVGGAIQVADADPDLVELRSVGVVADADGHYRYGGVRGLLSVDLTFSASGFVDLGPRTHPINPRIDPQVIDAELST